MQIHVWKISRELRRLQLQLQAILQRVYEPWLRAKHDRSRLQTIKVRTGQGHLSTRIAVFLLYQPNEVADSSVTTCRYLHSQGFAVMAVCNMPLTDTDLSRLQTYCWKILERPNFGYDFGGYRDAIWWLRREAISIQRLLILNDSIWFPAFASSSLLSDMEKQDADFIGAARLGDRSPLELRQKKKRAFLGSYFWLLKEAALSHHSFDAFWTSYKATNIKHLTVRRGERGFCFAMEDAGLRLGYVFCRTELDDFISQSSASQRLELLSELCEVEPRLDKARLHACRQYSPTPEWSENALRLIREITRSQNVFASAPIPCIKFFGVSFLKKADSAQNLKALEKILHHHNTGSLALEPTAFREIEMLVRKSDPENQFIRSDQIRE